VATIVEMKAIRRLAITASLRPSGANGLSHASKLNSRQAKFDLPAGRLKLNRIITAIGSIR
jgi:hypothetical protein